MLVAHTMLLREVKLRIIWGGVGNCCGWCDLNNN